MKKINKPNFFLLGAGKCGTSSMYRWLCGHPEIFMAKPKEPSFFVDYYSTAIKDPVQYFSLFDGVKNEKIIGEASHVYMTCPETPPLLASLFPWARFLVILRNPADRAFSLYKFMYARKKRGGETADTFAEALDREKERMSAPPRRAAFWRWNFFYFHSGLYGEQIERYLRYFDRSRFCFVRLGHLKKYPRTLIKILDFLNVDRSYSKKLGRSNRTPFPDMKMNPDIKVKLMKKYRSDLKKVYQYTGIDFMED